MTSKQVFYQRCFEDVGVGDRMPALTITVDETQLFFFSAATYNGHRIHYDKEWARTVEGYDDVLVQGPLQAALLARAIGDWIGGRGRLVSFSVQNRAMCSPSAEKSPPSASATRAPGWWTSTSPAGAMRPC
jgi:acyl dehydratase